MAIILTRGFPGARGRTQFTLNKRTSSVGTWGSGPTALHDRFDRTEGPGKWSTGQPASYLHCRPSWSRTFLCPELKDFTSLLKEIGNVTSFNFDPVNDNSICVPLTSGLFSSELETKYGAVRHSKKTKTQMSPLSDYSTMYYTVNQA